MNDTQQVRDRAQQKSRNSIVNKQVKKIQVMGATVLFTMVSLPVLVSVALVMVLVKGRMSMEAMETVNEEAAQEVYVPSSTAAVA